MGTGAAAVTSCSLNSYLSATESIEDAPGADGMTVTSKALNPGQQSYTPTTTPPVSAYSADIWVLDGYGEATIDLSDLPGTQGNVDGTGKRVQAFRIQGATGNGALTIAPGDTDPYEIFGSSKSVVYPAGCTKPWHFEFDDKLSDVVNGSGSNSKNIKLAGTAGDEFNIEILLG